MRRGYGDGEVQAVLGGNFRRLLGGHVDRNTEKDRGKSS